MAPKTRKDPAPQLPLTSTAEFDTVALSLRPAYEVIELLGRGGMATVYRARDVELDREVAIKVLPLALTRDPDLSERFLREARTAARLEHPCIIPVYAVGRANEVSYIVMKFLRGASLARVLRERRRLSAPEIHAMLVDVAAALEYAAARGVVHRDIKPDNILSDESGRWVVADFGIAKSIAATQLTATGLSLGTPMYMSPEQARGKSVDPRSDLYSLGVVAYHCLTGRVPFDADDAFAILYQHLNDPVPVPQLESDEQRALFAMILKLLAKDPAERPQHATDLLRLLGAGERRTPAMTPAVASPVVAGSKTTELLPSTGTQAQPSGVRPPGRGLQTPRAVQGQLPSRRSWVGSLLTMMSLAMLGFVAVATFGWPWSGSASRCEDEIARLTSSGTRARPDVLVLLDSITPVRAGGRLQVHYDVCGLSTGSAFLTDLTLVRDTRGARAAARDSDRLSRTFGERARGPASHHSRQVPLGNLDPGQYRLTLRVSPEGSQRLTASGMVLITPR